MILQIIRRFCRRLASNAVGNSSLESHLSVLILSFFCFSISQAFLHPVWNRGELQVNHISEQEG
jgi:hypothetical protein